MAALLWRGCHREQPVAAGQPEVEVTKLEDGDLIEFTAEVDVRPEFELPEFSTLQAQVDALDVPDTLVDQQLEVLRNRFGSRETVERPAADGDIVTINLVASREGEPLVDATADDVEYTIGSGRCSTDSTRLSPGCPLASRRPSRRSWSAVRGRTRMPTFR